MPTQQFAVERNGPKRVEVTWNGMWNDFAVKLDGEVIGTWTKDELTQGKEVPLRDGSTFKAHLRKIGMGQELALMRNGEALPGSAADPVQMVKNTAALVYFIGGYTVLMGVLGIVGVAFLAERGIGVPEVVVGAFIGALGFFTMQRSRIALAIAMLLYGADAVLGLIEGVSTNHMPAAGVVIHFLFLASMWRGFKAIGQLKAKPAT